MILSKVNHIPQATISYDSLPELLVPHVHIFKSSIILTLNDVVLFYFILLFFSITFIYLFNFYLYNIVKTMFV